MAHHQIHVTHSFNKSVDSVYAALADHNNLGKVFGVPVTRLKDGHTETNGVGSVRRVGPPPFGIQETVTAAETNRFIDYTVTRFGGPIRNHQGRLEFNTTGTGTELEWTIDFDSLPLIGPVLEVALTKAISRGLQKI